MNTSPRVLVANPDERACSQTASSLGALGLAIDCASSGYACLEMLEGRRYQAVVSERHLGDLEAEQLLEQSRRRCPDLAFVVVSAEGGPQEAVRLTKKGLDDYLPAGLPPERMAARLRELIGSRESAARASSGEPRGRSSDSAESVLIGRSPAIREVIETIRLIAPKRSTVLITGPTGTGKELAAKLIHALSPRAAMPMVTVNCGAIPEHLLESEFFGHVKGAFTGAVSARVGSFEQAHGSTLFLDEIGEMPFDLQAKMLRALQEREFQRVGSSHAVQVDVRVIAATNCDLAAKVRRGEFREDLYYRLNVVPVPMPPLAARLEDVPLLIDHILAKICRRESIPLKRVGPGALELLSRYHWPGNVRQLENALEKAIILSGGAEELSSRDFDLPAHSGFAGCSSEGDPADSAIQLPPGGMDLDAFLSKLERNLLEQALQRAAGNKKRAADMLGLKRTTLSAKLRVAGIRFPA
ncbi:MAG TPA: sigma-54 dependent transcriptional regulator [Bryobacterales bacterium]|jgi:DNA-binding NtrC family response regulator|nr:sigma-54 dependent transcriptional regulator [Bryobacterales bacterium]